MARKSVAVKDVVPLNRGEINKQLTYLTKTLKKGIETALLSEDPGKAVAFQQQALVIVEGKRKFL